MQTLLQTDAISHSQFLINDKVYSGQYSVIIKLLMLRFSCAKFPMTGYIKRLKMKTILVLHFAH